MIETQASAKVIAVLAFVLPEGRAPRRVRCALDLLLSRAEGLHQLLYELDSLAAYLCGHGDSETGTALLHVSDLIREGWTNQ